MKGIEQLLLEEEPGVYIVSKVNILDMLSALARLHKAKPKFNLSPQKMLIGFGRSKFWDRGANV